MDKSRHGVEQDSVYTVGSLEDIPLLVNLYCSMCQLAY